MASEEELWKKRLLEEDITPPDSIWAAIEAELDQSKKKRFVVWFPWFSVGGMAAAFLLIGFGVWVTIFQTPEGAKALVKSSSPKSSQAIAVPNNPSNDGNSTQMMSAFRPDGSTEGVHSEKERGYSHRDQPIFLVSATEKFTAMEIASSSSIVQGEVSFLSQRPYQPLGNRFQWNRPRLEVPEQEIESKTDRSRRIRFLALQSHAAPFVPGVQWPSMTQQAFAAVNETVINDQPLFTTSSGRFPEGILSEGDRTISSLYDPNAFEPEQKFERGWAVQMAAQAGIRLAEQWGIEVGLRYVQGTNSTQSNVYTWRGQEADIQTFFESSILRQSKGESSLIGPKETIDTRYHLISTPIQAIYYVPVKGPWDLSGSAGISLDTFISNRWSSYSVDQSYTPANSSYRPMAVSAVGGVRLGRKVSDHWVVVGGIFGQHSLSSWISESTVRMKPTQIGGQMGLSYQF